MKIALVMWEAGHQGHGKNRLKTVTGPRDAEVDRPPLHWIRVFLYPFIEIKASQGTPERV